MKRGEFLLAAYFAGFILPALFFFAAVFLIRYQHRRLHDVAWFRNRGAYKTARRRLNRLSSSQPSDGKQFAMELSRILRKYIGDKLNLEGKAITSKEVENKLREHSYDEKKVVLARKLLEEYEALQYSPTSKDKNENLLNESLELLSQLEKQT